jgi:Protein of unknown function (DUF2853)
MSKFDEAIEKYKGSLGNVQGIVGGVDEDMLKKVAKSLGPSIYLGDASLVSCSDQTELDRVKNNFLIKKLSLADGAELDTAIKGVCDQLGSSNKSKHRAVFYYLLAVRFGKQSLFQ